MELKPKKNSKANKKDKEENNSWKHIQYFMIEAEREKSLHLFEAIKGYRFNVTLQKSKNESDIKCVCPKYYWNRPSLKYTKADMEEKKYDDHQWNWIGQWIMNSLRKILVLMVFIF